MEGLQLRLKAGRRYVLDVSKAGRSIEYALLVEIHHPDYLTLADLRTIYGNPNPAGHEAALAALLASAEVETLR